MKTSPRRKSRFIIGLLLLLPISGLLYLWLATSRFQIPPPAPLPSPNGFDVYVAAAQAIVPANPAVDAINDRRKLTPQQAAVQYSSQRRRAWIASNAAVWQLMSQAKGLPSRSPAFRGVTSTSPAWAQLRELARCQSIRVKEAKTSNQWGQAMSLGLDTVEMGLNVERGSMLIGSLVTMAIESIGQSSLDDVPSHLSAVQAKAATRRLETLIAKAQPFSQVLTEEKWTMTTSLPRLFGGVATVSMMDKLIAQADKPIGSQKPVAPPSGFMSAHASLLFPVIKKSFFNDARRKAAERLLLLRLALRAYRVEHGAYPAQLSALSPTYLQSVPVDPFGKGEVLRYATSGNSYTAWSIGPDGIDNKGVSVALKKGKKRVIVAFDSTGDIVARP